MRLLLFACTVAILIGASCEKSHLQSNSIVESTCYKGKFLNGIECNSPLAVVEILDPAFDSLNLSYTDFQGQPHNAAIGLFIPDEFKNGETFYFSIDSIYVTPAHTANCFSVPSYTARVKHIGKSSCNSDTQ